MALLTSTQQGQLKSAIDLLVNSTAYETPISEDVIQRIAPVGVALGASSLGEVYETIKNNPTSSLIGFVLLCGDSVLTMAQKDQLGDAINLMLIGTAYEKPFAEDVIQRVAPVAAATYSLTVGGFYEAINLAPVSTMLKWALALGSE